MLELAEDIYAPSEEIEHNPHKNEVRIGEVYIDEVSELTKEQVETINNIVAKESPLKAYPNIEPIEELYYIEMFIRDDSDGYLRYNEDEDRWSIGSLVTILKCKFTMQEIKDLGEEQDNDFTQFAVRVEE